MSMISMTSIKSFATMTVAATLALTPQIAAAASPTTFVSLNPALGQLPESMTSDAAGNLYVSIGTTVGKISPAGVLSSFASLPVPGGSFTTGLKFGPDGYLYAATAGFTAVPAVAFVWRISPNGSQVEEYAELDPNGFPNDLAFDDDGNLYVTDPFLAQIWKIDEFGGADVWLNDPLLAANFENPYLVVAPFGVDGIAFDKKKDNLYVGNLDYGRILKIPVDCDGEADGIEVFYEDIGLIGGVDGLAFDKQETLYLAVHGQDRIVTIDKHRKTAILAEGAPLQQPSSLVFGQTQASKNTLYIANFAILALFGVKPGPPTPGVLKLNVKAKGLGLP